MALFHKRVTAASPDLPQISEVVVSMRKRIRALHDLERTLTSHMQARAASVEIQLNQDLSDAQLLEEEFALLRQETHQKAELVNQLIAKLKQCVLEEEFQEIKKLLEKLDPAEMITQKEFVGMLQERES